MLTRHLNAPRGLLGLFVSRFLNTTYARSQNQWRVSLRLESLEQRLALDASDPLSVLLQVPDTDNHVWVQFNRGVTGVDLTDFQLSLDEAMVALDGAQLEALSSQDYVLTLPDLFADGEYTLQLLATDSGISDELDPQASLEENGQVAWIRDSLAPSLDFAWSMPTTVEPVSQRIAALGDSQTTEEGSSYVPYLRQQLSSEEYSVTIFAEAGWKVSQVRQLWDSSVKDANYDIAVFFAGVNDLILTNQSPEEIFAGLSAMFDEALAREMLVVAVGVAPWSNYGESNSTKQLRGQQLNSLISQYADQHAGSVRYIDSASALSSVPDNLRLSTRFDAGDGLHLSSAGDKRLATLVQQVVEQLRPAETRPASMTVTASEPVLGLSAADFRLLRDGLPHAFAVTAIEPGQYRMDFEIPADDTAEYRVEWIGTEPIVDLFGNAIQGPTSSQVTIDLQAPTAQMTSSIPAISHTSVTQIDIQFSEPVSGLALNNIQLTRSTLPTDLSNAALIELAPGHFQLDMSQIALLDGNYRLSLSNLESQLTDLNGNPFRTPAILEWVQLAAEPTLVDGLLTIATTSRTESVELNIFSDHLQLWIGGLSTQLSLENVQRVQLDTLAGLDNVAIELLEPPEVPPETPWLTIQTTSEDKADILSLYGITGDDNVLSNGSTVVLSNSLFEIRATDYANLHVYGASTASASANGYDVAEFVDTSSTERFIGRPDVSGWTAPTYQHWAHGFQSVTAGSSGGSDTATLYDSAGDDNYSGSHTHGLLTGAGYSLQVNAFPVVSTLASVGQDSALLVGSTGVDTFVGQSLSSAFYGSGFRHNLNKFDTIEATGNGGSDVATMYDSTGADSVELAPGNGSMSGPGFTNVAREFPRINAYSRSGADTVSLLGSAGNDTFTGQESTSSMTGAGYALYAYRFPSVTAISSGGSDTAKLYDSTADDRLDSTLSSATLTTPTYTIAAQQFPILYAYARNGNDLAFLSGASSTETYTGYTTYGKLASNGRTQYAYGFDSVSVAGGGGADVANLYDSNDNDTFTSNPIQASLSGPGFQHTTVGFPRTNAYSRAGFDIAQLDGSTGSDQFTGQVAVSFVTSGAVANYAYAFDRVTSDGLGGNDTANLFDSTGDDTLVATAQWATLQSGAFSNTARGYARNNVYARSGYDTATLVGTSNVETFSGQTTGSSLIGSSFANYAYAFDAVVAESAGGADIAQMYDSSGDDLLVATSTSVTLSGNSYRYSANNFSRVNAYGRTGNDLAQLIGSTSSETVVVRPDYSYIKNASYLNYASGFDTVVVSGGGGSDSAFIYDSVGNDQLMIGPRSATMLGSGFQAILNGFYRINAYASAGNDRVTLSDSVGSDTYTGNNQLGTFASSGFTANLDSYDTVVLAPAIGGTNTLNIANLTYNLEVGLGWQ